MVAARLRSNGLGRFRRPGLPQCAAHLDGRGDDAADATMLKMFGTVSALTKELRRLQELNRSSNHYRLGPYHTFLVRELVVPYIQAVNDPDAGVGESPLSRVGCAVSRPHRHNTSPSTFTLSTRW
jgi:hypothetical protein